MNMNRLPNRINHRVDGSYLPFGDRLDSILRMRASGASWASIGAEVELPWQTCVSLARVADEHARRLLERAIEHAQHKPPTVAGEIVAMIEAEGTALVQPFK